MQQVNTALLPLKLKDCNFVSVFYQSSGLHIQDFFTFNFIYFLVSEDLIE